MTHELLLSALLFQKENTFFSFMSCILIASMNVDIRSISLFMGRSCCFEVDFVCYSLPERQSVYMCSWSDVSLVSFCANTKNFKERQTKKCETSENCSIIHVSKETEPWYMLLIEAIAAGTKYLPMSKTCILHEARSIAIVIESSCNENIIGHMHESSTWQKVTELEMLPCVLHARVVGRISFSWGSCNVFHAM